MAIRWSEFKRIDLDPPSVPVGGARWRTRDASGGFWVLGEYLDCLDERGRPYIGMRWRRIVLCTDKRGLPYVGGTPPPNGSAPFLRRTVNDMTRFTPDTRRRILDVLLQLFG